MWKYCEICCVNITIYIKGKKVQTEDSQKREAIANVATMPLGTIATVQKKKDKVAQ